MPDGSIHDLVIELSRAQAAIVELACIQALQQNVTTRVTVDGLTITVDPHRKEITYARDAVIEAVTPDELILAVNQRLHRA